MSAKWSSAGISVRRYIGFSSFAVAGLSGAGIGLATSFFLAWYFSLVIGIASAAVLAFCIPWYYARRARSLDEPAAALGNELLLNEPIILLFEKRHILARLCLTSDVLYFFFRMEGRVAYVSFVKEEQPAVSYGQNRDFLFISSKTAQKGVYFCADDLLSNIPHIYQCLSSNGWHIVD